jgi:hypothetical protein
VADSLELDALEDADEPDPFDDADELAPLDVLDDAGAGVFCIDSGTSLNSSAILYC